MEDVAAMVAEAIARRAKAGQARAAAGTSSAAAQPRVFGPDGVSTNYVYGAPGGPVAKPPVPMGRQPVAAVPAPAPAAAVRPVAPAPSPLDTALPDDGLPGLPVTIFDDVAEPKPQLLSAFSGAGLLAGIVLSEALARPVALREGGSGTLF